MTNPNELPTESTSDIDRYRVTSRAEVVALLRGLCQTNQLLRMSAPDDTTLVTAILTVDDDNDLLVIDCARRMSANDVFLKAPKIRFEGSLDHIKIWFSTQGADLAWIDNNMALQIPLPTDMIRLQRREDYRITTPVVNRIPCFVPDSASGNGKESSLPLQNISAGGVALIDETGLPWLAPDKVLAGCKIKLPGEDLLLLDLRVRTVQTMQPPKGRPIQRIGCEFMNPSPGAVAAINRFIARMERAQRVRDSIR